LRMRSQASTLSRTERAADLKLALELAAYVERMAQQRNDVPLWIEALESRALTLLLQEQRVEATDVLEQALALLEQHVLEDVVDDATQHFRLAKHGSVYQSLIRTSLQLSRRDTARQAEWQQRAWATAERGKARHTLQVLLSAARSGPIDEVVAASSDGRSDRRVAILRELLSVRDQWVQLQSRAERVAAIPVKRAAPVGRVTAELHVVWDRSDAEEQTRAQALSTHEDRLWAELRQLDPDLARLNQLPPPELAQVQAALQNVPDGAVLLELVPLPERLVVFVLTPTGLSVRTLPMQEAALSTRAQTLRQAQSVGPGEFERLLNDTLALVARLFWTAVEDLLPQVSPTKQAGGRVPHLLLVPSGGLHLWPLWALPIPGTSERLLDRYACSILPSADALVALAQRPPAAEGPYQGYAPPTDLVFARAQAVYAATILGGQVQLDGAATFSQLQGQTGGAASLYTHANFNLREPERPRVVFAHPDDPTRTDSMSALECALGLAGRQYSWLELAACEVHGVGAKAGDTWGGLSGAFLRASPMLMASIWRLQDAPSLLLSVPLLAAIQQGLTVPQALRQAQRELATADLERVTGWGQQIRDVLEQQVADGQAPAELLTDYESAWTTWLETMRPPLPGPSMPCSPLTVWAPYVCLGMPTAVVLN